MASLFGVVTYILPSMTIGVFSNEPSLLVPVWNIILGTRRLTFAVVICASVDHRWLQSLPPYVGQSTCPHAMAGHKSPASTARLLVRRTDLILFRSFRVVTGPNLRS